MDMQRLLVIGAGTVGMFFVMQSQRKAYGIPLWKLPVLSVLLAVSGVLGAMGLFFVENGRLGGTSFFGALFFAVPLMAAAAGLMRTGVRDTLDLCAPAECLMLAVLKIDCMVHGCCGGIVLWGIGEAAVRFPSQMVEMIVVLAIMAVLLAKVPKGEKYPWYLILYGGTRFGLNFLREGLSAFVWLLPPGHFWALVSVVVGTAWLYWLRRRK